MHSTSLCDFVSHARQAGRIRFGDLRRLQRNILPARLTTREEAEALIALDRGVQRADPDWTNYLVGAVRDFVVWGLPPIGSVDRDKGRLAGQSSLIRRHLENGAPDRSRGRSGSM